MGDGKADDLVLGCDELDDVVELLTTELGFQLDMIMPADDPRLAVLSGHGRRIRLERRPAAGAPAVAGPDTAPGFELTQAPADDPGAPGRAGMRYRDLLPSRRSGQFIASHITIPEGGPVPDYVHHHDVRLQFIYCLRGWVRVVYEDQGPPFVLQAGDCVLQPPGIRHRVLESSAGLEVLEVTGPAEHPTYVDHVLALPTPSVDADRLFGGQRFVRHRADRATWVPWRSAAFEACDTGIAAATSGVVDVRTVRAVVGGSATPLVAHDGELLLWFVAAGSATLRVDGRPDVDLGRADAVALPAGVDHVVTDWSGDLELVEVTVP
ncbi:MAG: cupin domain-containing protein [Ilumatobacteraceae bacterium]